MKTLDDIKKDMSELYDQVRTNTVDLKSAAEMANIAGKYLKAEQLSLARDIFLSGQSNMIGIKPTEKLITNNHELS